MAVFLLVLGLVLFIGLILVHEWGHFAAARRGGVEVEEYGVFFPPRLFKKRTKGGWLFTINALPLGGFVKLKGEHDTDTEPGSYGAASLKVKTQIMAAGVVMNLVTAYVLLMLLAWLGMPQLVNNQFTVASDTHIIATAQHYVALDAVENGSPAQKGGLLANDIIKTVSTSSKTYQIDSVSTLQTVTKQLAGQTVTVNYERDNADKTTQVTLNTAAAQQAANPPGYLGVEIENVQRGSDLQRSTWSAPIVAGGLIGQFTALTLQGLWHALQGLGSLLAGLFTDNNVARQHGQQAAASQVSGPIGIVVVLHYVSQLNYQFTLLIIALISLTLAIMNILPIPALDGGRLWLTLISRGLLKKPLKQRTEELVNASGFLILIGLSIAIAFVDVHRFL